MWSRGGSGYPVAGLGWDGLGLELLDPILAEAAQAIAIVPAQTLGIKAVAVVQRQNGPEGLEGGGASGAGGGGG